MESVANFTFRHHQHHHHQHPFTLHHRCPSISKPISSLSFTTSSSPPLSSLKIYSFSSPIRASFSNSPSPIPNSQQNTSISPLKTTLIVAVTAAAVFLSQLNLKPVLASTAVSAPPPPATAESESEADPGKKENEKYVPKEIKSVSFAKPKMENNLGRKIPSNPKEIQSLRTLMEIKLKGAKFKDALELLDKLLVLEPNNEEWLLLKAYVQYEAGIHQASMKSFLGIISKDPFQIEAYHGLVMAVSEMNSAKGLVETEEKIKEGLEKAKKSKKKSLVREFNILLAQILVMKEDYESGLRIYKDLIKEEPRDYRPYLCQGMIYTLLGKDVDAKASFEKYRRLVPEGHPVGEFLEEDTEEHTRAAKLAAQKEVNAKRFPRKMRK